MSTFDNTLMRWEKSDYNRLLRIASGKYRYQLFMARSEEGFKNFLKNYKSGLVVRDLGVNRTANKPKSRKVLWTSTLYNPETGKWVRPEEIKTLPGLLAQWDKTPVTREGEQAVADLALQASTLAGERAVKRNDPRYESLKRALEQIYFDLESGKDLDPQQIKILQKSIQAFSKDLTFSSDWTGWVETDAPSWETDYKALLRVKRNAKVFVVKNERDLELLRSKYTIPARGYYDEAINWGKLSREYHGFHLKKPGIDYTLFNLWDVESSVWWNYKALDLIYPDPENL